MPVSKELTIRMEDRPGTLGKCCRSLADRDVNILAFQAFEREGQSLIRMVVDDPASAKNCWMPTVFTTPKRMLRRLRFHIVQANYQVQPHDLAKPKSISTTPIAAQTLHPTCRWYLWGT